MAAPLLFCYYLINVHYITEITVSVKCIFKGKKHVLNGAGNRLIGI